MHQQHPTLCTISNFLRFSLATFFCSHPQDSLAGTAPQAWGQSQELWSTQRDTGDITFLHSAVVEAPGDPSRVCPEAAALPCALPGLDARVAAVYPVVGVGGTHFLHCVKQQRTKEGRTKCYFMLCLWWNSQIKGRTQRSGHWADVMAMVTFSEAISASRFTQILTQAKLNSKGWWIAAVPQG